MIERPLPLDKDPIILRRKIKHHLLNHTSDKIANNMIYRQTITRNHNPRLTRSYKRAIKTPSLCFTIDLQHRRHLSSRTIRAYSQDSMATRAMGSITGNHPFVRRKAYIPQSNPPSLGSGLQFLIFSKQSMQPINDIQTVVNSCQQLPAPFMRKITTFRRNANKQRIRLVAKSLIDIAHNRNTSTKINPQRLSDIHARPCTINNCDYLIATVTNHARCSLAGINL